MHFHLSWWKPQSVGHIDLIIGCLVYASPLPAPMPPSSLCRNFIYCIDLKCLACIESQHAQEANHWLALGQREMSDPTLHKMVTVQSRKKDKDTNNCYSRQKRTTAKVKIKPHGTDRRGGSLQVGANQERLHEQDGTRAWSCRWRRAFQVEGTE